MKRDRWEDLEPTSGSGSRRIAEPLRLVTGEMSDFDDDDIPAVAAGVLIDRMAAG
jgi:hypothetical protein